MTTLPVQQSSTTRHPLTVMKPHFPSLCASLLALSLAASPAARATISLTLAGYTNDFAVDTTAGDWITSSPFCVSTTVQKSSGFFMSFLALPRTTNTGRTHW